jgi:uncharacterized protein YcfJ
MARLAILLALFAAAPTAMAQYNNFGTVEIVRVEPRMITTYQQQCREVAVQTPATSGNTAGGVLGAIAGAAIGNQIGGGSGRDIATVVGGVVGYQAGRGESQPGGISYRTVCESVPVMTQRGETVTFRYRGRLFSQTFD